MNKIAIILGSFHREKVEIMLENAIKIASEKQLAIIKQVWVCGSLEKPLIAKKLLKNKTIDGLIILGIIEKGETQHGLVMGQAVFNSIIDLQLEFMKPIGVGIIGPGVTEEQIQSRLKPHACNAVIALKTQLDILKNSV